MGDQDINSIDEMSNEENMLSDDLFEEEENQQPDPSRQIVDSSPENTSIEEADKKEEGVPEIVKQGVPKKEDPTQFEYWQSEADRRAKELDDFKTQYIQDKQAWQQRETVPQLNPEPEPLVAPVKPNTDDPNDLLEYMIAKDDYRDKVLAQRQSEFDAFKQETVAEKQLRLQQEQDAQFKAQTLGAFQQQQGYDLEKANRALNYFSKSRDNPDYIKDLAQFYDWKENQIPGNRTAQIQQRVNRQGEVLPLGVQTSKTETKKVDDNEAFFDEMKVDNFGKY